MKKIMYVLIVAFIGAVLFSGCINKDVNLSVTGTVHTENTYNPYGNKSEPSFYKIKVVVYNNGSSPITLGKVKGTFFAGNTSYPITIIFGERYGVLEPGKSTDLDFKSLGKTYEMQNEAKAAGKVIAFNVTIHSGGSKIPVYGADLPSLEALNGTAIPLNFTQY